MCWAGKEEGEGEHAENRCGNKYLSTKAWQTLISISPLHCVFLISPNPKIFITGEDKTFFIYNFSTKLGSICGEFQRFPHNPILRNILTQGISAREVRRYDIPFVEPVTHLPVSSPLDPEEPPQESPAAEKTMLKPEDSQRKRVSMRKSYRSSGALRERLGAETMMDHTLARLLSYVHLLLSI